MTIDELDQRGRLQPSYRDILSKVEGKLKRFFAGEKMHDVAAALTELSDDAYIDVIYLQYRDGKTLEWIAEALERDSRTITRNKKRLIIRLYELMDA